MGRSESSEDNWQLLFRTTDLIWDLYARHHPECNHFKITMPQIKILNIVSRHYPDSLKLKDIASELRLTPGAISPMVDSLVRAKLLERQRDAADRRAINIQLSAHGIELRKESHKFFNHLTRELLAPVSPEKRRIFREVLEVASDQLARIMREEG